MTSTPPPPYPRRPRAAPFVPRFTFGLLYVGLFVLGYCLLFALPDLIEGARELPPGGGELTPEELERASAIAQRALAGKVPWAVAAALATFGVAAWRGVLPGLRR